MSKKAGLPSKKGENEPKGVYGSQTDARSEEMKLQEAMKEAQEALRAAEQEDVEWNEDDLNDPQLLAEMARLERGEVDRVGPMPSQTMKQVPVRVEMEEQVEEEDNKSSARKMDVDIGGMAHSTLNQEKHGLAEENNRLDEGEDMEMDRLSSLLNLRVKQYHDAATAAKRANSPNMRELALVYGRLKEMKRKMDSGEDLVLESDIPNPPVVSTQIPDQRTVIPEQQQNSNLQSSPFTERQEEIPDSSTGGGNGISSPSSNGIYASRSPSSPSSPAHHHHGNSKQQNPVVPALQSSQNSVPSQSSVSLKGEALRQKRYEQLEGVILGQLDEMKKLALEANALNKKVEALAIINKRKILLKDLELMRMGRMMEGCPPPAFHIETNETIKEILNEDLSSHEIELRIIKVDDIKPLTIEEKKVDLFIQIEIPFPDPSKPSLITTSTYIGDSLSPSINFIQKIRIERTKALVRTFQKKKISFSIFKPKTWFFGSPKFLGKAELKIAHLLENSDLHEAIDLVDETGHKIIGGKIHVSLRLRHPLSKKQMIKEVQKVLVIDKHFVGEYHHQEEEEEEGVEGINTDSNNSNSGSKSVNSGRSSNTMTRGGSAASGPASASASAVPSSSHSTTTDLLSQSTISSIQGVGPSEGASSSAAAAMENEDSYLNSSVFTKPSSSHNDPNPSAMLIDISEDSSTHHHQQQPSNQSGAQESTPSDSFAVPLVPTQISSPPAVPTSNHPTTSTEKKTSPSSSAPSPSSSSSSSSSATMTDAKADFDFNSAQWMISHSVLGWRKEELEKEIKAAKLKLQSSGSAAAASTTSSSSSSDDPSEPSILEVLEAKKDDVDHKMTILITLVQTGNLTEEEYIRRVKVKIGEEEELLTRLTSVQRLAEAALCKKRIQIMKEEIGL